MSSPRHQDTAAAVGRFNSHETSTGHPRSDYEDQGVLVAVTNQAVLMITTSLILSPWQVLGSWGNLSMRVSI